MRYTARVPSPKHTQRVLCLEGWVLLRDLDWLPVQPQRCGLAADPHEGRGRELEGIQGSGICKDKYLWTQCDDIGRGHGSYVTPFSSVVKAARFLWRAEDCKPLSLLPHG